MEERERWDLGKKKKTHGSTDDIKIIFVRHAMIFRGKGKGRVALQIFPNSTAGPNKPVKA
jgi:hypothetical protein